MMQTCEFQIPSHLIPQEVKTIIKLLKHRGYETYLVGGCVRDLLLNHHPKDFDIVTQAKPSQIKHWLPGASIIGKRFPLVLLKRNDHVFEISTFRKQPPGLKIFDPQSDSLPSILELKNFSPKKDAWFGTAEDDAKRRDFTINALFYDPNRHLIVDWVDGLSDLRLKIIRSIGHPAQRILEDPVRILRAIRTRIKTHFAYDHELLHWIRKLAYTLEVIPKGRRRLEILKFLELPDPTEGFLELHDLGILGHLAPKFAKCLETEDDWDLLAYFLNQNIPSETNLKEFWLLSKVAYFVFFKTQDLSSLVDIMKLEFCAFNWEIKLWANFTKWRKHWPAAQRMQKRSLKRRANFFSDPTVWLHMDFMETSFLWDPYEHVTWICDVIFPTMLPRLD